MATKRTLVVAAVWVPLLSWTFKGKRFDDHGVDLADLESLISLRKILVSFAHDVWRRDNSKRERAPKGYESKIELQFFTLEKSSSRLVVNRKAYSPTQVEMEFAKSQPDIMDITNKLPEAADMFNVALDSIIDNKPPPFVVANDVLRQFGKIGRSLRADEHIHVKILPQSDYVKPASLVQAPQLVCLDLAARKAMVRTVNRVAPKDADTLTGTLDVEFSGTVSGHVADRGAEPVHVAVSGRGKLDPGNNRIYNLTRLHAVATADDNSSFGAKDLLHRDSGQDKMAPMYHGHAPERVIELVQAQFGDSPWPNIARILLSESPEEFSLPDIVAIATRHGLIWQDVQAVVEMLAAADARLLERTFLTIDSNPPVKITEDEVARRLRAHMTQTDMDDPWDNWSRRVRVSWRWTVASVEKSS